MKKHIACLALSLAPLLSIAAPPTEESVATLFKVMKTDAIIDSMYASIEPMMRQSITQVSARKPMTEEQKKAMDSLLPRMISLLRSEVSWEKIQPIQIAIYQQNFDQTEIDAFIEFYKSPVGQTFVNKTPLVMQQSMAAMQTYMGQVMPKIQAAMQQGLKEADLATPQ
jgi:hypothetical protein